MPARLPKATWLDSLWELWSSLFHELGVDAGDEIEVEEIVGPAFEERSELPMIGVGTTRAVFALGDAMVLKLPLGDAGHVANKIECARYLAFQNRTEGKWLAPTMACDNRGRWLVQLEAKPMPRGELVELLATTQVPHDLATLGVEDFRTPMQWGKIDGRPVLIDYGTWHHENQDVETLKRRLLAM